MHSTQTDPDSYTGRWVFLGATPRSREMRFCPANRCSGPAGNRRDGSRPTGPRLLAWFTVSAAAVPSLPGSSWRERNFEVKTRAAARHSRARASRETVAGKRCPGIELLERRELLSLAGSAVAARHFARRPDTKPLAVAVDSLRASAAAIQSVLPTATSPSTATFIDPTAILIGRRAITIGIQDYVAPFATLMACSGATISIGNTSNVQDNVRLPQRRAWSRRCWLQCEHRRLGRRLPLYSRR